MKSCKEQKHSTPVNSGLARLYAKSDSRYLSWYFISGRIKLIHEKASRKWWLFQNHIRQKQGGYHREEKTCRVFEMPNLAVRAITKLWIFKRNIWDWVQDTGPFTQPGNLLIKELDCWIRREELWSDFFTENYIISWNPAIPVPRLGCSLLSSTRRALHPLPTRRGLRGCSPTCHWESYSALCFPSKWLRSNRVYSLCQNEGEWSVKPRGQMNWLPVETESEVTLKDILTKGGSPLGWGSPEAKGNDGYHWGL